MYSNPLPTNRTTEKDEWVELIQNVIAGKIMPAKKTKPTIGQLAEGKQQFSGRALSSSKTRGSFK
ncbi:hypothetical protein SARC_18289, partial [Sphaeroforma arctica JP610]